jgi:hypothetical protein
LDDMTYHETPEPRRHPFGHAANGLVWAGGSLGLIQAAVFVFGWGSAPLRADPAGTDGATLAALGVLLAVGAAGGWLCWWALTAWRAREPRVLKRLVLAAVLLLPIGLALVGVGGAAFSLAGALLGAGAVLARRRIVAIDAAAAGRWDRAAE